MVQMCPECFSYEYNAVIFHIFRGHFCISLAHMTNIFTFKYTLKGTHENKSLTKRKSKKKRLKMVPWPA